MLFGGVRSVCVQGTTLKLALVSLSRLGWPLRAQVLPVLAASALGLQNMLLYLAFMWVMGV